MNTPVVSPEVSHAPSLKNLLDDLHAHRVKTMNPADLAININQRALLVSEHQPDTIAQVGSVFPDFDVAEVNGSRVRLADLVAQGPAVIVFFRFANCPACNIALPYYQRNLYPALQAHQVPLLALSPQQSDKLVEIKQRHHFDFLVATDSGNALGRELGILYEFDEASKASALAKGAPIGEVTGTGTWELPKPTVVVLDRQRVIRFIHTAPDWLARAEAEPILAAVADAF